MLEAALYFDHGIKSMRMNLVEINEMGHVDKETGNLYVDGHLIGFVYYRSGYDENQFFDAEGKVDERTWQARTMMECSMAIPCPSIDAHLTTFKKF